MVKGISNRIVTFLKHRAGYKDCPLCKGIATVKWVKDPVVFEEEPPMFFHMKCTSCGATSDVLMTTLTKDTIKQLGYGSIDEYMQHLSDKEK